MKVKLTIEIGKKKIELTESEAKELYMKLKEIHGDNLTDIPYYDPYIQPFISFNPVFPWEKYKVTSGGGSNES